MAIRSIPAKVGQCSSFPDSRRRNLHFFVVTLPIKEGSSAFTALVRNGVLPYCTERENVKYESHKENRRQKVKVLSRPDEKLVTRLSDPKRLLECGLTSLRIRCSWLLHYLHTTGLKAIVGVGAHAHIDDEKGRI